MPHATALLTAPTAPAGPAAIVPRFLHHLPTEVPHGARLCLWGASVTGLGQRRLLDCLRPDVTIVAFADSFKTGSLDGLPILSPDEYLRRQDDFDLTIITAHKSNDISQMLAAHGVERYTRYRGVTEIAVFPDAERGDARVCTHQWEVYPSAVNRYRRCTVCGAVNKYLVAPWCQLHDDYGKDYWQSLHLVDGIPQNTHYEAELLQALAQMGLSLNDLGRTVLEVGAGVGRLVPLFLRKGWDYRALEPSEWAARFMREAYSVPVSQCILEEFPNTEPVDMVLSLHTLEHIPRADFAFERLVSLVKPGGYLFLALPDAEDLLNLDHVWFFHERVLETWSKRLGLETVGVTRLRPFHLQDNIYFIARKPAR